MKKVFLLIIVLWAAVCIVGNTVFTQDRLPLVPAPVIEYTPVAIPTGLQKLTII